MMPSCLSILFRALRIEWRETKRTLFPTTPIETGLFLFFFLLYGCIGYRMLFHTELIDVPNGGAGSYLGYDNLFHLHTRGGAFDISHPFFGIFHLLKTLLTILLTTLFKEKTSGIICLTLMNLLITGGLVLIYRYLKQIVRISPSVNSRGLFSFFLAVGAEHPIISAIFGGVAYPRINLETLSNSFFFLMYGMPSSLSPAAFSSRIFQRRC